MALEGTPIEVPLPLSKYSKRVLINSILSRSDGGVAPIGQRVVVGGWVKSSREFRKEPATVAPAPVPAPAPAPAPAAAPDTAGHKDVTTCVEVLQTKLPFLRSIIKAFGGEQRIREKLGAILPKPPPPQASISILQFSDGSCTSNLQVVVDSALAPPSQVMPTGTCVLVEGILQKPSLQGKETIEVKAEKILHIGSVDQDRYPLSKKRIPLESLRDTAHFRPRTTTVASVMRIRNALTQALHTFCQENEFLYIQVPVITSTDCEALSDMFQVTTLLEDGRAVDVNLETVKASIREKSKQIEQLKRSESNKEALAAAVQDLNKTNVLLAQLEAKEKGSSRRSYAQSSNVNPSDDFFSCKTYLTVSGRLHLESYASAMGNVYTFGPRFHATRSESKKMLAEMWMVELQMAFSKLEDAVECANDFLKFICKWVLDNCKEDLKFISRRVDKFVVDRLELIITSPFQKISYSDAVEVLKKVTERNFETKVEWGRPLNEEHENYLVEEIYKSPIIVYSHPKDTKPFYARLNDDGKTVASFDVILPKVGTVIRGSQNEERYNALSARIRELGMEKQEYEWYLDLHRHGAVKCSGFSFLFDLLVLYGTGLNDVRDAVPFPRTSTKPNN